VNGRFFLSYSRRDQDFALRLAGALRAAGVGIWIDQFDILPSDRWDRVIETAIRDGIGMVLVLSPRSVASDHVLDEVAVTLDAGKPVIPVLMEHCQVPLRLARVHQIDATGDFENAVARCRAAMEAASGPRGPDPTERVQAPEPGPAPLAVEVRSEVGRLLAVYLGPISPILVEQEARGATSVTDLAGRLAQRIPNPADRSRFMAAVARSQIT
jgi:hypothetical protein